MCRFESSQKDESIAQSANSSKAYKKPRAFIYSLEFIPTTNTFVSQG